MATGAQVTVSRCQLHPLEDKDIHCFDCKVDVCELCIQSPDHIGHKWGSISRLRKRRRAEVIKEFDEAKNSMMLFKQMLDGVECINNKQRDMINRNLKKIEDRQNFMIEELKKIGAKNTKLCTDLLSKRVKYHKDFSKSSTSLMEEYESLQNEFEKEKTKASDDQIMTYGENLKDLLSRVDSFKLDEMKAEQHEFVEGMLEHNLLDRGFGRLKIRSSNIRAVKHTKFVFGNDRVSCIYPVQEGAWMRNHYVEEIKFVDQSGNVKLEHKAHRGVSAFLVRNNSIIFTEFKKKFIGQITSNGSIEVLSQMTPLGLGGICLDHDDENAFYVCITDNNSVAPLESVERSVTKMSFQGEVIRKIEFYRDKRIFNHPYRICQSKNLDLCVVDRTDWHAGVVHVLHNSGIVRFTYKGLNTTYLFNPCGVVTDELCRIIISDCKNNKIHILDEDGNFLKFLLTEEIGLFSPWSLGIWKNVLWVGSEKGEVTTYMLE